MARKFPHVGVIGIDLTPVILNESAIPDNCQFELGDVNRGLPRFYDQIDLIHMRSIASGVSSRRHMPIRQKLFWSILEYYWSHLLDYHRT